jgi:hypothetical protein
MGIRDIIEESHDSSDGLLFADGFDSAIIGVCSGSNRVVYSYSKGLEIIQEKYQLELIDAIEYMHFNVMINGEKFPIWVVDNYD